MTISADGPSWVRKRDWARKHLDEIEDVLQTFYDANAYRTFRAFDVKRSAYLWRVVAKEPPKDLSLMVGDCAHNMRSALDHLIWAAALQRRRNPDRMITFPLSETPEQWENWLKKFRKQIRPEVCTAIEGLQVHDRPNPPKEPAVILHRLDRDDKHKLVWTVNSAQVGMAVRAGQVISDDVRVSASSLRVGTFEDTTEVASVELSTFDERPLTQDPNVNVKPDIALCVGFANEAPGAGQCVDILLLSCLDYVDGVFAQLDPLL